MTQTMRERLIAAAIGKLSLPPGEDPDPENMAEIVDAILAELREPDEMLTERGAVAICTEGELDPYDASPPELDDFLGLDDEQRWDSVELGFRPFAAASFTAMIDAVRERK